MLGTYVLLPRAASRQGAGVRLRSRDLFQTVHTEGGLLPADLLQRIADGDRTLDGLRPSDYHLDPGERLNERDHPRLDPPHLRLARVRRRPPEPPSR